MVTFSSSVLVNEGVEPVSRFDAFTLNPASAQALQQIQNRLNRRTPTSMNFAGSGLLAAMSALEAIEALDVMGGQPRTNAAGYKEAAARAGELVTVSLTLADGAPLTSTGIVTSLALSVGPGGGLVQTLQLVFSPCDRLRFTNGTGEYVTAAG